MNGTAANGIDIEGLRPRRDDRRAEFKPRELPTLEALDAGTP